jgi:Aldo/keto reductase family
VRTIATPRERSSRPGPAFTSGRASPHSPPAISVCAETRAAATPARTLGGGNEIPLLGLGVWQVPNGPECVNAVRWALELGYRHIDTAQAYGNEESVGQALRGSGLPREEVFLTTKFYPGREDPVAEIERSLRRLCVDRVDLYIIHSPAGGPTWASPGMGRARARSRALDRRLQLRRRRDRRRDGRRRRPARGQPVQFSPFKFAHFSASRGAVGATSGLTACYSRRRRSARLSSSMAWSISRTPWCGIRLRTDHGHATHMNGRDPRNVR